MRIPIATFAETNQQGLCDLQITYLNFTETEIILGGMFYQEMFAVYENDYSSLIQTSQTVTIYEGLNPIYAPYVGNAEVTQAASPFTTTNTDSSTSSLGTWAIVGITAGSGILLIAILLGVYFCICRKDESAETVVYEQNEKDPLVSNINGSVVNQA